jgi:hypothetical protein
MAISAVNLLCVSDPHDLHVTVRSLSRPIITSPVNSPKEAGRVRHQAGERMVNRLAIQRNCIILESNEI